MILLLLVARFNSELHASLQPRVVRASLIAAHWLRGRGHWTRAHGVHGGSSIDPGRVHALVPVASARSRSIEARAALHKTTTTTTTKTSPLSPPAPAAHAHPRPRLAVLHSAPPIRVVVACRLCWRLLCSPPRRDLIGAQKKYKTTTPPASLTGGAAAVDVASSRARVRRRARGARCRVVCGRGC